MDRMPLYEYECDACGHKFEQIRKFSDPPLAACPKCAGAIRKLVSSPAFQFKGSGWYATDYGNKAKDAGKSDESKPDGSKPDGSKSEGSKESDKSKASQESKDTGGSNASTSKESTTKSASSTPTETKARS